MENKSFQSQSVCGDEIELRVLEIDSNTIEIIVSNLNFKEKQNIARTQLLFFFSALLLGGILAFFKLIVLHIALIVLIFIRLYCFLSLVQFEKLTVTKDFGVQLLTAYSLGRKKSVFLQFTHLHEVVITEVIQNLKTTFMLSFLTKGDWYEKRPIIPIMNAINPRLDVLKIVYNILRKYVENRSNQILN